MAAGPFPAIFSPQVRRTTHVSLLRVELVANGKSFPEQAVQVGPRRQAVASRPVPPGGYGLLKRATKLLYRRGAANKLRALLRG